MWVYDYIVTAKSQCNVTLYNILTKNNLTKCIYLVRNREIGLNQESNVTSL